VADEVLAAALKAIGRKERTEAEIRGWLADRGYGQEDVDRAVVWLTENLALDDARFAAQFASDKRSLAGWGNERIEATLLGRGVAKDLVVDTLRAGDSESEVDRASRVLAEREFDLSDPAGRRRALGLLARRGFSAEDSYAAIRRAAAR
jgi:regulatory protein